MPESLIAVPVSEAKTILRSGQFVTVTFTKEDGTVRVLNGRSGVAKGVKGVGMAYDADAKNIVILYEANNEAEAPSDKYRAVRVDRVIQIRAAGKTYVIAR
jgi:hypothetical protein